MDNTTFFDDLRLEPSSYWFGFFCADGHLYKSGRQVSIGLSARDAEHLEKFAGLFNRSVDISSCKDNRTCHVYHKARCVLSSKYLHQRLLGYVKCRLKTLGLSGDVFDSVPGDTMNHFVRGYFDGDGCIYRFGKAEYRVSICGTKAFLERLRDEVSLRVGVKAGNIFCAKGCHVLAWGGTSRIVAIRKWLYNDANVFLNRKKLIFDQVPLHRGLSRYKYVYWSAKREKWLARYYENGSMKTIGQFSTEAEAANARTRLGLPI